jgi:O-antigen/teichoic acid export membrane protein
MIPIRIVFANFSWLIGSQLLCKFLAVFISIYVARTVGVEGFGIIALAASFVAHFRFLLNEGMTTIGVRELSSGHLKIEKLFFQMQALRLIFAFAALTLLIAANSLFIHDKNLRIMIAFQSLGLLSVMYSTYWVYQAKQKMMIQGIGRIFNTVAYGVCVFLFLKNPDDVVLVPLFISIGTLAGPIPALIKLIFEENKFYVNWDWKFAKNLIKSSIPLSLASLAELVFFNTGILLLKYVSDVQQVGYFNASYKFFLMVYMVMTAIFTSLFPAVVRSLNNKKEEDTIVLKELFKFFGFLAVGLAAGSVTIGHNFVSSIYGNEFAPANIIFQVLMIGSALHILGFTYGMGLIALNKQKQLMWQNFAGAGLVIIITYILGQEIGALGLAVGIACGFAIRPIWALFVLNSSYKLKNLLSVSILLRQLIIGSATVIILSFIKNVNIFIMVLLGLCVYLSLCVLLGILRLSEIRRIFGSAQTSEFPV